MQKVTKIDRQSLKILSLMNCNRAELMPSYANTYLMELNTPNIFLAILSSSNITLVLIDEVLGNLFIFVFLPNLFCYCSFVYISWQFSFTFLFVF